jgi:hypothetical protein
MKHSLAIEVINQDAFILLKGMERLNLIKVFQKKVPDKIDWTKYKGAMSRQPLEEIDRQLNELRNAWE